MDVSVIIPTQGTRPSLLNQAIRSVFAQTVRIHELIVIVDGSEEVCRQVRGQVEESGLGADLFVATGVASGVSVARNLGAETATGGMLAFLDDDDLWKPGHLREFDDGAFDIGLGAFLKFRDDDEPLPEKTPPSRLHPRRFLVVNPGLRGSNLVIRRDVYRSIGGFRPCLPALNDLDFGIRLSEIATCRYRRVCHRHVMFRSHHGPRLTTVGSDSVEAGVRTFWRLHRHRMDIVERQRFADRALALWRINVGEDP